MFHGKKTVYSERECRSIIYQIARAMQYTHARGNVHRDLRDINIFVEYPKHKLSQKTQKQKIHDKRIKR